MNKVLIFLGSVFAFGLIYPPFFGFAFGVFVILSISYCFSKLL